MSKTTDALANLSAALRDTITIIKDKLLEQASTDKAAIAASQSELTALQAQYQEALTALATSPPDEEVASQIEASTTALTTQLNELVAIAQTATPAV